MCPERAVGDVIDMGCQVIALRTLGDEGAQLDVLPDDFLDADIVILFSDAVGHAVEGYLGGVGDKRKDGVVGVAVDGFQDGFCELLSQLLALMVDVAVGASAEIDAFERTACLLLSFQDGFED